MLVTLEAYDWDLERFEQVEDYGTEDIDCLATSLMATMCLGEGEAWRLLGWEGNWIERVVWLSRPAGL